MHKWEKTREDIQGEEGVFVFYSVLKGRRASKYNIGNARFKSSMTSDGGSILKSVLNESEKAAFTNPLYGHIEENEYDQ